MTSSGVKKVLTSMIVMLLLSAGVVFAQNSTTTPPVKSLNPRPVLEKIQNINEERREIKGAIKDVREDSREKIKDLRLDTKETIKAATSSVIKRDLLKNTRDEAKKILEARKATTSVMKLQLKALTRQHFGLTIERYSIALKQFDNLAARIQSRIEKIRASGANVSTAESSLAAARIAIEKARADSKVVSDIVAEVSDTSELRAVRLQIAEAIKRANASVKAAHRALGVAAAALAKLHRPQKSQATSTETSN